MSYIHSCLRYLLILGCPLLASCGPSPRQPSTSIRNSATLYVDQYRRAAKVELKAEALEKLASIAPEGLSEVQRVFDDPKTSDRWLFIERYFAQSANPQVSEALVSAISDRDIGVREEAIRFVSSDTVSSCVSALANAVNAFPENRIWAIWALRRVATPEAFDIIRTLGTHPKSVVRETVAGVLRGDTSNATRDLLNVLSKDKSKWVAMTALSSISANGFVTSEQGDVVKRLHAFADAMTGSNRLDALILLTRTRSADASAVLAKAIRTLSTEDQERLAFEVRFLPRERSLSDVLLRLCVSGSERMRSFAISTLALQAEPRVVPIVERTRERKELTDWACAFALRKLRAGSIERLVDLSTRERPACYEALIGLVQRGVDPTKYANVRQRLLAESTSAVVPLRKMAAYVLRNINDDWATVRLKELESDWNREVQMIAKTGFMIRGYAGPPGRSNFEESLPFYWVF